MGHGRHRRGAARPGRPPSWVAAIASAATTTAGPNVTPGSSPRRPTGPDTPTAASTEPSTRTGALTDATPGSRSPTLAIQPNGPISPERMRPAEPRSRDRTAPSATIVRSSWPESSEAMQRRRAPSRTYSCTLSPVSARRRSSAGRAPSARDHPAAAVRPRTTSFDPRVQRPSPSRRTSPWTSSAPSKRWAVALGRPLPLTTSPRARGRGAAARTSMTETDLSRTPTPLIVCSTS